MNNIRVLIVDDHHIVREGLRSLLETEPNIEVVGEAKNGEEAVNMTADLSPDIVLMDIRMPIMHGIEATSQIKARTPLARVIILSSFDQEEEVFEAIRCGASGYVLKDVIPEQLVRAINTVSDGYSLMSPQIARKLQNEFQRIARPRTGNDEDDTPLTPREGEVLALIAQGYNNREIASALSISEKTVKTHVSNIFDKLQITDRSQAVLYAARRGLIS
jgi:DNA-binding NarL/FixJ family response regulator